jgi:CubicO group peptidase (beta-lactamase class C family)
MARRGVVKASAVCLVVTLVFLGWYALTEPNLEQVSIKSIADLEVQLEALRQRLRIPGMSAAIADNDRIVWVRGFGTAKLDGHVPAAPETIYHLASLTKPYASTVLLQLVEEGRLDLEMPVSHFGITIERSTPVKLWHLLSHTSGEPPGTRYRYDGNAFARLTQVIEHATGRPFITELVDRIIRPLALTHTAPNPEDPRGVRSLITSVDVTPEDVQRARAVFAASGLPRESIEAALAQGYARAWGRWFWPTGLFGPMRPMPHGFTLSATGGLAASAVDVARFSIALDDGRLLSDAIRARAWAAPIGRDGRLLPYALGWFVQQDHGDRLVWHYGHGFESSSLIVKIPDRRLTFVVLANSDGLSRWRGLGDDANVRSSPAATLFLKWYSSRNQRGAR